MLKEEQAKEFFLKALMEKSGSRHLMNYMKELNSVDIRMESESIS